MTALKPLGAYSSTAELYADSQEELKIQDAANEILTRNNTELQAQLEDNADLRHDIERHVQITTNQANEIITMESHLREVEAALRNIIDTYDAYRRRGVLPAPKEYSDVVIAIEQGRSLAPDRTDAEQLVAERVELRGPHVG